jgi:hypothetical protein
LPSASFEDLARRGPSEADLFDCLKHDPEKACPREGGDVLRFFLATNAKGVCAEIMLAAFF